MKRPTWEEVNLLGFGVIDEWLASDPDMPRGWGSTAVADWTPTSAPEYTDLTGQERVPDLMRVMDVVGQERRQEARYRKLFRERAVQRLMLRTGERTGWPTTWEPRFYGLRQLLRFPRGRRMPIRKPCA